MRRITELYGWIKEEELYRKNAAGDLEQMDVKQDSFREDEKERILEKTMEKIQRQEERKRSLPGKKRLGILILAAALLTALTVSAAEYFQVKKELADALDLSEELGTEQVSSMLTDFSGTEASVTAHGVTVRAEQAICDGRAACICFAVELPEGIFLENSYGGASEQRLYTYWNGPVSWSINSEPGRADIFQMWREARMWIGTEEAGCGPMIIERSEENPDRYYVIEMIGLEEWTRIQEGPKELKLVLTDLGYVYADGEKTEWTTQIEGTWTLAWTMEFEDQSQTYEIGKEFQKDGKSVFVQSAQVSPLGIRLIGATESEGTGGDFITPGSILTRDGSLEQEDVVSVWAVGEEGGIVTVDGSFGRLMDVDDIIGVQLNKEDLFFRQ